MRDADAVLSPAGDPVASRATVEQAIDIGQRCGDARTVAFARTRLAQLLRTTGESEPALEVAAHAVDWFRAAGGGDGAKLADYLLAALHADSGMPTARDELDDVLQRARESDPVVEVLTLDALAVLDVHEGLEDAARSRLAAADDLASQAHALWAGDRIDSQRAYSELNAAASPRSHTTNGS